MKSGFKTTEFWVTAAVVVLAALNALLGQEVLSDDGTRIVGTITTMIAAGLASLGYAVSRGIAKHNRVDQ